MDYVYEKAPLIEVIAEIHWSLKKLDTAPDARIDPYYDLFKDGFLDYARNMDLGHTEELVPDIVPLELLPNQPRLRLRTKPGRWPLAQLGPGIVTANIVPPYEGWKAFEPFLHKVIDGLYEKYPISEKTLRIQKLHLRYIDGFDDRFGFEKYALFADEMLGINMPLSTSFIEEHVAPDADFTYLLENRFRNRSPAGSSGTIKIAPGKLNSKNALVMELHCESAISDDLAIGADIAESWFGEAHECLHLQFESLATNSLKRAMGSKREVV